MAISSLSRLGAGGLGGLRGAAHRGRRGRDRLDDVHVPGAAAEVALQALPDVVLGRGRVLLEKVGGRHDEAGGAVAALQAVLIPESLLDRMQRAVRTRQPFDGLDLATIGLNREHGAGFHRLAVDVHRAGAALAGVAPDVGACQPDDIAEIVHQEKSCFDLVLMAAAVDRYRDSVLHTAPPRPREWLASTRGGDPASRG